MGRNWDELGEGKMTKIHCVNFLLIKTGYVPMNRIFFEFFSLSHRCSGRPLATRECDI